MSDESTLTKQEPSETTSAVDIPSLVQKAVATIKHLQDTWPADPCVFDTGDPAMARLVINTPIHATHVLVINNNHFMFAHAQLLSAKSRFFAALMSGQYREKESTVVHIEIPYPDAIRNVMGLLYGACEMKDIHTGRSLLTLIALAEFLGIDEMCHQAYKMLGSVWRESYEKAGKKLFCEVVTVELLDRVVRYHHSEPF